MRVGSAWFLMGEREGKGEREGVERREGETVRERTGRERQGGRGGGGRGEVSDSRTCRRLKKVKWTIGNSFSYIMRL